jgi:hypothetical protein
MTVHILALVILDTGEMAWIAKVSLVDILVWRTRFGSTSIYLYYCIYFFATFQIGFYYSWTEWSACFNKGNVERRARNRSCSAEGQCRHLGENVQYEQCIMDNEEDNDEDNDDDGEYKLLRIYSE